MDNFIPIILVAVLFIPIAWGLTRRFEPNERTTILKIVFLAMFVRLGVAFLFAILLPEGYFGPDSIIYMDRGMRLAAEWQDPNLPSSNVGLTDRSHFVYYYVCGGIYYLVGPVKYAPAYFNALFGMTSLLLLAKLLHIIFAYRIVRNFLIVTCFFPSIILFHTYPLKDTLVFLFVIISLYNYTNYLSGRGLMSLLYSAIVLLPLYYLRFYLVLVLFGIYIFIIFFFAGELSVKKIVRSFIGGLIIVIFSFFIGIGPRIVQVTEREVNVEQINRHQVNMKEGASAMFQDQEYHTGFDVIRYFPIRITMFLFSPFPWQITSAASALAFLEMPFWWFLLPFWISGFKYVIQYSKIRQLVPILLYAILVTSLYAIVEGNIGTMFRKRAQVLPLFLLFATVGWGVNTIKNSGYPLGMLFSKDLRKEMINTTDI